MKTPPLLKMAASTVDISSNLKSVLSKIELASKKSAFKDATPRLVAVSKTKPISAIIQAYEAGQRHFGENYARELVEKAQDAAILDRCKDIRWHMIGHLQSNKVAKVLAIPNLYAVETVDSAKMAVALDKCWMKRATEAHARLNVFAQVNTSGESEKSGITPSQTSDLCKFIINECKGLRLRGLMTIGQFGYNPENGPNPDFVRLIKCRDEVVENLHLKSTDLELSMGMSDDFEQAIELGSTNVRVGSSIFGSR